MSIITKAKLIGFGSCLPGKKVHNDHYASYLDTNHEWIYSRTGITNRHICENESLSDLAQTALAEALECANITAQEIDVLIVATTTADNIFPSCSTKLHGIFNMLPHTQVFDVGAACNGFIYALELARLFLTQNNINKVAIIGADIMSRLLDKNDRSTVVLFGDGASAIILEKTEEDIGFLATDFGTDGKGYNLLYVDGGHNQDAKICMQGSEIFIKAVKCMVDSLQNSLQKANLTVNDLDLIIPHQANIRIIESIQSQLSVDASKIVKTIKNHGNTSAASIPLAIYHAYKNNQLQNATNIACCGFGAGLSWGSVILKIK